MRGHVVCKIKLLMDSHILKCIETLKGVIIVLIQTIVNTNSEAHAETSRLFSAFKSTIELLE